MSLIRQTPRLQNTEINRKGIDYHTHWQIYFHSRDFDFHKLREKIDRLLPIVYYVSFSPRDDPMCVCCRLSPFSGVRLFANLWTVAHQAPLSMGVSRQEYYRGLPCLPPRDLPDPGIGHRSPAWQADSLPLNHQGSPNQERLPHAAKWRN